MEIPEKYVKAFKKKYGEKADIEELRKLYEYSLITPNEAVGVIAAQSVGEASTQLTLRTKHVAGLTIINTTFGLPRLIEIFDAKKEISTPIMEIYLKPEYAKSKQKASEIASKIIEIKVGDIISSYDISLRRKSIELILDREAMREYRLSTRIVESRLSKMKLNASIVDDKIVVSDKSLDQPKDSPIHLRVKKLIKLRNKIIGITLSGIPRVSRAILTKDKDGTFLIKTMGSNLEEIMKMDEIDQVRTASNDIMEVANVLGIEAGRNLIISEVHDTLQNVGLNVDLRHILLIADAMCVDGTVRGIGRYGLSGETESVFARAAFEIPLKHLVEASLYHEVDEFKFVANNVISNQVIPIGTGAVKLVVNENGREHKEKDAGENKE